MHALWLAAFGLAGCGRIGFDPVADPDPSAICPFGALLCDDFETGDTSNWSLQVHAPVAELAVDTVRPWRGNYALHGMPRIGEPSNNLGVFLTHPLPLISSGLLVGRLYFYASSLDGDFTIYFSFRGPADEFFLLYAVNFTVDPNVPHAYEVGNLAGVDRFSTGSMPIGTWLCLELTLDIASGPGRVTLSSNGATVVDFTDDTLVGAGYDRVQLGVERNPATANDDFFLDDVAVATMPIGCE